MQPTFPQPDVASQDARRSKRAAARESRKSQSSSAVMASSSLQLDRQRLEGLVQSAPSSTKRRSAPPAAVSLSVERRHLGQTLDMLAGPSLLPAASSSASLLSDPSSLAREANARRARLSGRRTAAAAGVMDGAVRTSSRAKTTIAYDGTRQFMKVRMLGRLALPVCRIWLWQCHPCTAKPICSLMHAPFI